MLLKRVGGEGEDTLTHLLLIGIASSVVCWVGKFVSWLVGLPILVLITLGAYTSVVVECWG